MQNVGLNPKKQTAYFKYDFAIHGGAIGDITVRGSGIPVGAVIVGGLIDCPAACLGGAGATLEITAVNAGDVMAAGLMATLGLNALVAVVPVPQTANTWIRVAAPITSLTFTPAVADMTAGQVVVALEYYTPR
jgi:hypothetical protein